MSGKSLRCRRLVVLSFVALAFLACGDSRKLVGSWKGIEGKGYNRDLADFLADGSCKLLRQGERVFCSWSKPTGGDLEVKLDAEHPENDLKVTLDGDEMWLDGREGTDSHWIRSGSELDASATAYTEGEAALRRGDYDQGLAALKKSADRGFTMAQNILAWTYATVGDPRYQDGKQAVAYAEKALAEDRHHELLDTLAAALARDGQYKKASDTEKEALEALGKDGSLSDEERAAAEERFRRRLELYQGGQPYTEEEQPGT